MSFEGQLRVRQSVAAGALMQQPGHRVMRPHPAVELLLHQLWRLAAQHPPALPQVGLEFVEHRLDLPALVIQPGQLKCRSGLRIEQGRIAAILPSASVAGRYRAAREWQLPDHLLMPGLVNTHGHAAMTLLRGLADDHTLMDWLQNHVWPAEARWVGEDLIVLVAFAGLMTS